MSDDEIEVNVGADCGECGDTGWIPDYNAPIRETRIPLDSQPGVTRVGERWYWSKPCPWCGRGNRIAWLLE